MREGTLFCRRDSKVSALKITAIVFGIVGSFVRGSHQRSIAVRRRPAHRQARARSQTRRGHPRQKSATPASARTLPASRFSSSATSSSRAIRGSRSRPRPAPRFVLDSGLLVGNFRAKRIDLIDAIMTLRVDENGRIGITAADQPPAPEGTMPRAGKAPELATKTPMASPSIPFVYPELASWLDRARAKRP